MAQKVKSPAVVGTDYDALGDIQTFSFTETPQLPSIWRQYLGNVKYHPHRPKGRC